MHLRGPKYCSSFMSVILFSKLIKHFRDTFTRNICFPVINVIDFWGDVINTSANMATLICVLRGTGVRKAVEFFKTFFTVGTKICLCVYFSEGTPSLIKLAPVLVLRQQCFCFSWYHGNTPVSPPGKVIYFYYDFFFTKTWKQNSSTLTDTNNGSRHHQQIQPLEDQSLL